MTENTPPGTMQAFYESLKRYVMLQLDYARLTGAEKLTVLLSTIMFCAMVVIFGTLTLVFISIGIGHLLAMTIAPHLAYLIVAGFYFLIFIAMVVFRRQLFTDPTARLITRLFVKRP